MTKEQNFMTDSFNKAIESLPNLTGRVEITINDSIYDKITICITDNEIGIPKSVIPESVIPMLGGHGGSFNKVSGTGLGLRAVNY